MRLSHRIINLTPPEAGHFSTKTFSASADARYTVVHLGDEIVLHIQEPANTLDEDQDVFTAVAVMIDPDANVVVVDQPVGSDGHRATLARGSTLISYHIGLAPRNAGRT